jgi:ParB-like chromosome segregation protein Spo0J
MAKKKHTGDRETRSIAIEDLTPNPKNPRRHDVKQIEAMAESVRAFGQVRPILARAEDLVVIAGHGVLEACRMAGLSSVQVVLWDVDERTANSYMIADNRHHDHSVDDDAMIAELIRELEPDNYLALGFIDNEVDELLARLERGEKNPVKVREIATHDVEDKFWISVRGPVEQQARALQAIRKVMDEMPDVTVEQGVSELN